MFKTKTIFNNNKDSTYNLREGNDWSVGAERAHMSVARAADHQAWVEEPSPVPVVHVL